MLNKNLVKLLACLSIGFSSNVFAEYIPDYTCPEAQEVKEAILSAIQKNTNEITINTRFGILQANLDNVDVGDLDKLTFSYATFLFGDINLATFEVACGYKSPNFVLYKWSEDNDYSLYMGASPNWIPDENQLYATCTYSARYCVFMKKPA